MPPLGLQSTRDKLAALTIAVVLGAAFAGWTFVVKPKLAQVAAIRAERGGDVAKKELVATIASVEKRLTAFDARLPESGEVAWLTEALNRLADAAGVSLLAVTPVSREPFEGYYRLPVRIEVECGYHELGDFVSRVENNPRFIKINVMRVESSRTPNAPDAKLRVAMSLSALFPQKELVS